MLFLLMSTVISLCALLGKRHIAGPSVQKLLVAFSAIHSQMHPQLHKVCIPSVIHQDVLIAGFRKYFRLRYGQKKMERMCGSPKTGLGLH